MRKHLVLSVHGIGEQVPGATVDALTGAAREQMDLHGPVTNTTVMLADKEHEDDGQLDLYPCHMRRIQQNDDTELVFAEAHWADLSRAPSGVLATLLDLMRLVLGLGYLALENVENNGIPRGAAVRWMVPWFVWVFYAVIAPINLFLFICAAALAVDPMVYDLNVAPWRGPAYLASLGVGLAILGRVIAAHSESFLARSFARSFGWFAVFTALFGTVFLVAPDWIEGLFAGVSGCADPLISLLGDMPALSCYVSSVTLFLKSVWVFAVGLLIALVVVSVRGALRDFGQKRSIYLAICAAMLLLWMTFSVGFWWVFKQVATSIARSENIVEKAALIRFLDVHFADLTQTLVYSVLAMLVLGIVAVIVVVRRSQFKHVLAMDPDAPSQQDRWYGRLILNPSLNMGLFSGILILAFGVFYAVAEFVLPFVSQHLRHQSVPFDCETLVHFGLRVSCVVDTGLKAYGHGAIAVVALLGLLIVNFSNVVAMVLGVARDVIIYVTRSEWANPTDPGNPSRYVYRDRIERRFTNTVEKLLDQEGPEVARITVVSHSQGTVVARRGLQAMSHLDLPQTTLITMGSPLSHIYGQYFYEDYQFHGPRPKWLKHWHNIYRADDFVGTTVQGHGTAATNTRVRPKGHTGYWVDRNVWDVFEQHGVFKGL
ncbi:hypothetical protein [Ascidiaceihabitans sp.]|uniref:hypothetical protein n=1 Tax=Ascidiaceihabitans sp. TaxID=1872644 RepID=UPI0032984661